MNFFHQMLQFLFPRRCVGCRIHNEHGLCHDCLKKIHPEQKHNEKNILSVFSYKNKIIKEILWQLKFNNNKDPLCEIIPLIADTLIDDLSDKHVFNNFQKPLLVPIPLHPKRLRERGFNQSEYIIREITKHAPHLFEIETNSLVRKRETQPQARIQNRSERERNVKDCFMVKTPDNFHNRNIIVIDDISTTGSTLREAMYVLKKAGARQVYGFVVAH